MDPDIWGELPWDLIELVASFADFDTRRALGIPPGKLPKSDFIPHPIKPTTFRYFPALKKLLFINFDESLDNYQWETYEEIEPEGEAWYCAQHGNHRGVWRGHDDFMYFDARPPACPIYFAGVPEIISV
jgi:hypothetical protein